MPVSSTQRVSLPVAAFLGTIVGFFSIYILDCLLAMTYWRLWNRPGALEQIFFNNEYAQVKGYFGAVIGITAGTTLALWGNGKRWTAGWVNLVASVGLFGLAAIWVLGFIPRYMHTGAPIGYVSLNVALVVVPIGILFIWGIIWILMGPTGKKYQEAMREPLANPEIL